MSAEMGLEEGSVATLPVRNGGTDTGITSIDWVDSTTTTVFTMRGTPNGAYVLRWVRFGR